MGEILNFDLYKMCFQFVLKLFKSKSTLKRITSYNYKVGRQTASHDCEDILRILTDPIIDIVGGCL